MFSDYYFHTALVLFWVTARKHGLLKFLFQQLP